MNLSRFFAPFYITNLLAILLWIFLREMVDTEELIRSNIFGFDIESQIYFGIIMVLSIKYLNSPTLEMFIGSVFLFSKLGICILLFAADWKLCVWYCVFCFFLFFAFPQPAYKGPTKAKQWIGIEFEKNVELSNIPFEERKTANKAAFVMFYTQWATNCPALSPILAQLSLKYATEHFIFGKVDIGRAHQIGKKYRISTASTSKQLPTFILFENGKESLRLPEISHNNTVISCSFTEKQMDKYFEFEQIKQIYDAKNQKKEINRKKKKKQ